MKTTDPRFVPGQTDKNWFKKGHRLSAESLEKMRKAKTKYTPEELAQREKARAKDPDRVAWQVAYYKRPSRRFQIYRRSAQIKHIDFSISFEEFLTFWQKTCSYCGDSIDTIGLDRIDNSVGYIFSNLISCCKLCNYMKREIAQEIFFSQCQKISNLVPKTRPATT